MCIRDRECQAQKPLFAGKGADPVGDVQEGLVKKLAIFDNANETDLFQYEQPFIEGVGDRGDLFQPLSEHRLQTDGGDRA